MILSEKIMSLRKQAGWSQEDLAGQLNVSRQSVSKWESGASVPDLAKIVQMSGIFGVSTDYLLKDTADDDLPMAMGSGESGADARGRYVSNEEAAAFMDLIAKLSSKTALGVLLCIWSPILLIFLSGLASTGALAENTAVAVGLVVLFLMVAAAVLIFILTGSQIGKYNYLETEPITLQYGVEATVRRRQESFENVFRLGNAAGVIMIILGVIPVCVVPILTENGSFTAYAVCLLLFLIGCAVFLFVKNGMVDGSFKKLLQADDYSSENKQIAKKTEWFPRIYWPAVTAVFLAYSFITEQWDRSWIIWPVAALLFVVVYTILKASVRNKAR